MGSTRRDLSGVFDDEVIGQKVIKAAVLDQSFHLDRHGITFVSDKTLTPWVEVGVQMQLPSGTRRAAGHNINCRAVVVQCLRRRARRGYEVALLFLDLPKRAQARLGGVPPTLSPQSVSITR